MAYNKSFGVCFILYSTTYFEVVVPGKPFQLYVALVACDLLVGPLLPLAVRSGDLGDNCRHLKNQKLKFHTFVFLLFLNYASLFVSPVSCLSYEMGISSRHNVPFLSLRRNNWHKHFFLIRKGSDFFANRRPASFLFSAEINDIFFKKVHIFLPIVDTPDNGLEGMVRETSHTQPCSSDSFPLFVKFFVLASHFTF